jgi:hypothetical protein
MEGGCGEGGENSNAEISMKGVAHEPARETETPQGGSQGEGAWCAGDGRGKDQAGAQNYRLRVSGVDQHGVGDYLLREFQHGERRE